MFENSMSLMGTLWFFEFKTRVKKLKYHGPWNILFLNETAMLIGLYLRADENQLQIATREAIRTRTKQNYACDCNDDHNVRETNCFYYHEFVDRRIPRTVAWSA